MADPIQLPEITVSGDDWKPKKVEPIKPSKDWDVSVVQPSDSGWLVKSVEPLTSYPAEYAKQNKEARERMSTGAEEFGKGDRLSGAFKMGTGALDYAASPITAGLHTVVGKPIEDVTGIPHEYTEFGAGLAIPGYGFTKTKSGEQVMDAVRRAAKTVEQIASPETIDADAKVAVGAIREAGGQAARDTAQTEAALEPAWKKVNAMPATDRLDFLDYVENRSGKFAGTAMRDPELQDLANKMRSAFELRMNKLQALPSKAQADFIEDYFPHFWKDPAKAQAALKNWGGMSKQGSGASLKKRTVPTIADGIAMGLEPVTTDPIAATLRYVQSMDRFIAATDVLDTAKDVGTVKYIRPQVMGASGHPDSFKVPDGWVKLNGRGSVDGSGAQAYAPEGWARIYNNWVSRGIAEVDPSLGNAYEATRRASNAITAFELGLSGYHALTMMQESVVNSVANAVGYTRKGHFIRAGQSLAKAAVAPIASAVKGKKLQNVYLGLSPGSRDMQKITDLLTEAGGRAGSSARHAPDYDFSSAGSYVTALKRGALKLQLTADAAEAKGGAVGTAKVAARHIGRIMDTVAEPLFQKYIPWLKNGAFYDNMSAWLKANPNATHEQELNAARQIWDSVDNRFGELVQDNIFINKTLKQMAMLGLRSWSWTVGGDIREIAGGVRDVARAPFKSVKGTGPQDVRWTQKMDYAIALPIVYGTLSAIYQKLKTGKDPEGIQDLLAPQTGGTDASTGQPERLIMPGYMKDVFGFAEHPVQEVENKVASGPKMMGQLLTNQDWRGDPIFSPASDSELNAPRWLQQFWNYASQNVGPISARSLAQGKKQGSNISGIEQVLGVRSAPRYLTDPEGYEKMMKGINERKWKGKEKHDRSQQRLYGE